MGTLYLVATPIGNLEDISLRAIRVLGEVSLIAAEDTRSARRLLAHLKIHTPLTSYFEHNERSKLTRLLSALENGDVAVVSDAGMPGLSDPGAALVKTAIANGVRVVPIPGANSVIPALVVSGLPTAQFLYLGFLPRASRARLSLLKSLVNEPSTLVAFESPHRLAATLEDIERTLGDPFICIAREMTKVYEEFLRGKVSTLAGHFRSIPPRGEFTIVISGAQRKGPSQTAQKWTEGQVRLRVHELMKLGTPRTEAVKQAANESGWVRRKVYEISTRIAGNWEPESK